MKIGFVLDDGLDKEDGVQQYILTLGGWLRDNGHEVHYIVGETHRTDIPNTHSVVKNIKVRFNGNVLSVPRPASSKIIKRLLRDLSLDIIHVQVPYSPLMGGKVVKNSYKNSAIVGTFHILPYGWLSQAGSKLLALWLNPTNRLFDRFISVSSPAAVFAADVYGIKSAIIPNLVDMNAFRSARKTHRAKNSALKLTYLGRLVERKGCRQLLQAMVTLNKRGILDQIEIHICGDGPLRSELESFTKENGISLHVNFHGYVTEEYKKDILAESDICVFPAIAGESFGIVLIEAMAAGGGIVLAGNNPGYESVLGAIPESIIDAHDTRKLADQLQYFIEHPESRKKLYVRQQQILPDFDVSVVGKKIEAIYSTCKKTKSSE